MANEDQKDNDHRLHIEACPCGNPSPQLGGDDFDADIYCHNCNRTIDGFGTKGAIYLWNEAVEKWQKAIGPTEKKEAFPRPIPEILGELEETRKMLTAQADAAKENRLPGLEQDLKKLLLNLDTAIKNEAKRQEKLA